MKMIKRNIFTKSIVIALLALSGATSGVWAQTKTVVLSFNKANIQATSATVNVGGTGATGVTATVGRATQTASNTPTNYFTTGAGYNDNILGVNYTNSVNNYWEIPFTITGLRTDLEYTITTEMVLLNNVGNKQTDGTQRTWIETIYVNGAQHATTGNVTMYNGNASSVNRTFNPFTPTSPLNLTVRMQRTDANGCFAGIKSITLSYNENAGLTLEQIYGSPALQNGEFANDTKWYSIRSHRRNNCYFSVSNNIDANENLNLVNSSAPTNNGGYWCFVAEENGGFSIRNRAYGPEYVLASVSDGNNVNVRMYHVSELSNTNSYIFDFVENTNGADAVAFRFRGTTDSNINASNNSPYPIMRWNADGNRTATDQGSAFYLAQISDATLNAAQPYTAYKVNIEKADASAIANYVNNTDIIGLQSVPNGKYMLIKSNVTPVKANFTLSGVSYLFDVETTSPANQPKLLTFYEQDPEEFTLYTARIIGEESLISDLSITMSGERSAKRVNVAGNGETLRVKNGVNPLHIDFTIDAPADNFVWGPIIDNKEKTVTYEVRDLVTESTLSSGWYQLQIADAEVAALSEKIIPKAGNINTKANTLYLAPSLYRQSDANKILKVTGVPQYAGEASTFVYVKNNGNGSYSLTSSITGQSITGPFSFSNGVLTKSGSWSYEGTAHPLEGPFLMPTGNSSPSFKVSPANISDYNIYKVSIKEGEVDANNVSIDIKNSNVLGSTIVGNGGYLFMQPNSIVPLASHVSVIAGNVIVNNITTSTDADGVKSLVVHVVTKQDKWKAVITGNAVNLDADCIVYDGKNYKDGESISIVEGYKPTALDFKTNVTDRFVWGPIIDNKAKTVKFEIKTPVDVTASTGTPLNENGWYQFVLVPNPTNNDVSFINTINSVSTASKSRKGSYIYMFNADTEFKQNASNYYPAKFAAVPENGEQATSFFYVTANSSRPQFQALNGHIFGESGFVASNGVNRMEAMAQNVYGIYRWSNYNTGSSEQPYIGASGTNRNFYVRAVKVDPNTLYDVYRVNLTETNQNMVRYIGNDNHGVNELYNNGYLLLTKGATAPTLDDFFFDSTTNIESIAISGQKVITFTVSSKVDGYTNTIIHRHHDVYDRIDNVDDNLLPKGSHIKRDEGMIEHPMKDEFTSVNNANDRSLQNTSVFHVTQYTKPETSTECILPHTKDRNSNGHVNQYQRWYNYQTERPLDNSILALSNFYQFTNGHCNYDASGARLRDVMGSAKITLPNGYKELYVGVDASEFSDLRVVNGNLVEPSLNMRVIYHIISAHEMAKELTTSGDKWWEAKEYFVPNIKRGSDNYKNNADLIPLDMPFSNYWIYKTEGTVGEEQDKGQLMSIVAENGNYNTLKNNLEIKVEGSAASYIDVGVFDGNPGKIGGAPYINGNHFLYYKVKGDGVTRTVPAGSQAIIKVYAKDGSNSSSPKYQLFKFILNFQGATEPLAITSVVGNPNSTRSVDYFIKNGFKESASLTFQNKDVAFSRINGHRADNNEGVTYAFPIDFTRTSYGYSPNNTFANYRITTKGYGIQYRPVSLYEQNIKNRTNTSMQCEDDYFFYIDAAESPGQVASITLDGTLCVGSRLYCYGWFGSSNNYDGAGNPAGASVLLQVVGHRQDGTEEVIASYLPGTVTNVSYDDEGDEMHSLSYGAFPSQQQAGWMNLNATEVGVWNSVGFSFVVKDVSFDSYDLRIINNCFSTSGGDYVLDDFRVFVSPPKGNVDFTTPLCSDALRHVKVHTDFDMLLEAAGANEKVTGNTVPVSFCFLNKKIYDEATKDYYDVDEQGNRTLKAGVNDDDPTVKSVFNKAFGDALIGVRSIDKTVKGHAFHNFTVPVDFDNIHAYAYNESPDDEIFKEEKDNGERRVVFKEQLYQSDGSAHNWVPGESYYLLFAPFHVAQSHVASGDVGTSTFDIASLCCVLTTFDIMPPIEVKGDATVTSSDQVKACDNQIITFTVDMPAKKLDEEGTGVSDAVISGLNYDWWIGTSKVNATHAGFLAAKYGTYSSTEDARRYNHQAVDDYPDEKDVKKDVYLESALENIRFYFPEARTLDEVSLVDFDQDNGYGIVKEHIDCVRHFITAMSNGRKPLSLFGQTFNLKVSHAEADENHMQHFVAIPIIPKQDYGVDEKLIYCPAPQELIIHVADQAPNLQNGFGNMPYPDYIVNVPVRIGKQQIDNVRKDADADLVGNTLNIPLRNIQVVDGSSTKLMAKDHETERFGSIYLTATDDNYYSFDTDGGEFTMRRVAQVIDIKAEKSSSEDGYMKIAFTKDFPVHEGCTYTLKLPYVEDVACQCEGTLVFDIKVVPEYQVWTGAAGNSDWTNDNNWARADRSELYAGEDKATGVGMKGATSLNDADSYVTNEVNTTANSFVPMYFTNVLLKDNDTADAYLYKDGDFVEPDRSHNNFLGGLKETATKDIVYDLSVTPVDAVNRKEFKYDCDFTCELFDTYMAHGINFQPATQLMNAHLLKYDKAWVEYKLETDRWYTLSSPLQDTYAGEWFAPTGTTTDNAAKQLTPYFYTVNWEDALNDRFRPAFYQRSWDSEGNINNLYLQDGSDCNAYIANDWSYVYNDVLTPYEAGGFSVKVSTEFTPLKPEDGYALVRMPKDDKKYTYFDIDGQTHDKADDALPELTDRYRLWSDREEFTQQITNAVPTNNFFLVGNPYMANLNMDEFFKQNPQLEKAYWVMTENNQTVSVRAAYDNNNTTVAADERWTLARPDGDFVADSAVVAPLQGFFVKTKAVTNTTAIKYTLSMQTAHQPVLRSRAMDFPDVDPGWDDDDDEPTPTPQDVYSISGMKLGTTHSLQTTRPRTTIVVMKGKKVAVGE